MAKEIERKFLVKGDFRQDVTHSYRIVQGYLSSLPERNVRIRIVEKKAYITIKGSSDKSLISRYEWEKEIKLEDALDLIKLCEPGIIEKERFLVPEESGLVFEVDVFHGDNKGLVVAEIELPYASREFIKPLWLGDEVSGDEKYYNSSLVKRPYNIWFENK